MYKGRIQRLFVRLLGLLIQIPRVLVYWLLSNNQIHGRPKRYQPIHALGRGKIVFEDGVKIGVFPSPFYFSTYAYIEARNPTSEIIIGQNTWINNNFTAISESASIIIGCRCLIGANVEIIDSDFHAIKFEDRQSGKLAEGMSVHVEDDVFIGSNVKIMKGVHIGEGSVIANGAIVTKSIPGRVVAGGVPAKVINKI